MKWYLAGKYQRTELATNRNIQIEGAAICNSIIECLEYGHSRAKLTVIMISVQSAELDS